MSRLRSESSAVWYDRLNLVNKFKRFCQWCTGKFEFWCLVGALTLIEPILCSKWPVGIILWCQVALLAASTVLYVIQLIGVASKEWEKIIMIESMSSLQSLVIPKHMMDLSLMKVFIFFTAEGEYILEFFCLTIGWILIFWHPGLAALRCFRPFRLLWFYEVAVFRSSMEFYFNPIFGEVFVSRGFRVLKFAIKSLSALGNEMFRLTADTKGGLLLMMIFFYSAFVLGTCLWIEMGGNATGCTTAGTCMYMMMRLALYDTNGFDFAYLLTDKHKILFFIVMLYMCITAFGILNGLVGIFGTAFARASDIAFEDEEDRQAENDAKVVAKLVKSQRNLYADGDEGDESDNEGGGAGASKATEGESKNNLTEGVSSTTNFQGNANGSSSNDIALPSPAAQPKPESLRLTMRFVNALQQKHLRRSGASSAAAAASYQSMPTSSFAAENAAAATALFSPNRRGSDNGAEPLLNSGDPSVAAASGGSPPRRPSLGGAGMFTSPRTSANVPLAAGGPVVLPPTKVAALVHDVHFLEHCLEQQSQLMENMMEHIDFLQKQIKIAYPEHPEHKPIDLRLESFASVGNLMTSDNIESVKMGSIEETEHDA